MVYQHFFLSRKDCFLKKLLDHHCSLSNSNFIHSIPLPFKLSARTYHSTPSFLKSSLSRALPSFKQINQFNTSTTKFQSSTMETPHQASLIDGKKLATQIRLQIQKEIESLKATFPNFRPQLTIIQVGNREDSEIYVKMKQKAAEEVGIAFTLLKLKDSIQQHEIIKLIQELNDDPQVHGILVQLPLPSHIQESEVTNAVSPEKDVDGFHTMNIGNLAKKHAKPFFLPCTPKGIMRLLESESVTLEGLTALVIGRSNIVGMPIFQLLQKANATVTLAHSKTRNLPNLIKQAELLIVAIGKPEWIQGDWIRPGAIVIDVGTNYLPEPTKPSGTRLCGDVAFHQAIHVAEKITPVPGGVGPMTVCMLLENTFEAAKKRMMLQTKVQIQPLPLTLHHPTPSDVAIAQTHTPKPIETLLQELRIPKSEVDLYGNYKAKLHLSLLNKLNPSSNGYYVVVTGITPTPLGEGKSTTTIGLAQALNAHLNKVSFACVRQPSQGPTFGIKGGAAGGGYAQILPMEEFNLHLTGDIHATTAANNLLAAALDTRLLHERNQSNQDLFARLCPKKNGAREFSPIMFRRLKKLGIEKTNPEDLTEDEISKFVRLDIDPTTITWKRVMDTSDRFLRTITIGEHSTEQGMTRKTGFDIAVASECMAVLALSTSLEDMRKRLGRMVVAYSKQGNPITADDLGVGGAMAVLMKDALMPTLMQTLEGTPVFVHAGPFANIAHGNSSILADQMALKLASSFSSNLNDPSLKGYVLTEAGFGSDIGLEKFMSIKCRASGLIPDAAILVVTIRALKMHGGGPEVVAGKPLPEEYTTENLDILRKGLCNMMKHLENIRRFGVPAVVALNHFATDTEAEIDIVAQASCSVGAPFAISKHFSEGGKGAMDLGKVLMDVCESSSKYHHPIDPPSPMKKELQHIYSLESTLHEKILNLAKTYGAIDVSYSEKAQSQLDLYTKLGYSHLPICMAKTHLSFSHRSDWKGVPQEFVLPIREIRLSAGAGFIYPIVGEMQTMPGLPTRPCFYDIDIDVQSGRVIGLC